VARARKRELRGGGEGEGLGNDCGNYKGTQNVHGKDHGGGVVGFSNKQTAPPKGLKQRRRGPRGAEWQKQNREMYGRAQSKKKRAD